MKKSVKTKQIEELKQAIGQRIREKRADSQASQTDVEQTSGVDRGIIGKIEHAKTDYRINSLLKVAIALGIEHADLS